MNLVDVQLLDLPLDEIMCYLSLDSKNHSLQAN